MISPPIWNRWYRLTLLPLLLIDLVSCSKALTPAVAPPTTPTPAVGVHDQLRAAFKVEERPARLQAVLTLMPAFLDDLSLRNASDQAASTLLTDIAFSSRQMTFTDRAFIRRYEDLAIVGLPDAMGVYFVDRARGVNRSAELISRWTAGLDSMEITPRDRDVGLVYTTLGLDHATRAHFALLRRTDAGWGTAWFSDDTPDWWFNAVNAQIALAPDLSKVTLVGDAAGTTPVFLESGNVPRRRFRVGWVRTDNHYDQSPSMGGAANRQSWLWHIAEPSAYSTLVEFVERLRNRDFKGAAGLVTDSSIVVTAQSFGLYLPENTYTVTAYDMQRIAFQGRQGAFVAIFQPPAPGSPPDTRWLISSIEPAGLASPTPPP